MSIFNINGIYQNLLNIKKTYAKNVNTVIYEIKYTVMQSINTQNIARGIPLCLSFSDVDLDRRSLDDKRQVDTWKNIVTRFKGKLVKMIKDANIKFDDYSISPKIRQILLHWGYELTKSGLL